MPFESRPLEETANDLAQLAEELTRWGVHLAGDRLGKIRDRFSEVQEAVESGRAKDLEERADLEDIVWASVEALEFAEVYRNLRPLDQNELKPLFEKVLEGPLHPGAELAGTSAGARNTMFQLRLGAAIRATGGTVAFEDRSDLRVTLPTGQLFIECKRPFKGQNIRSLVEKARDQLAVALEGEPPGSAGLAAISVARVMNAGSRILSVDDPTGFRILGEELLEIHRANSSDFASLCDPRLLGMIYHTYTPAIVRSGPGVTMATQSLVQFSETSVDFLWPVSGSAIPAALLERALGGL